MTFNFEDFVLGLISGIRLIPNTIIIAILPLIIGLFFGILSALLINSKIPLLSPLLNTFITFLRGIPLIVFLFLSYFFTTDVILFNPIFSANTFIISNSTFIAIYFAFSCYSMIRATDIYRGALDSVETSQIEAAKTLNFSVFQIIKKIILPQATIIAIPMIGNLAIGMLKATSVVSILSVGEILLGALYAADLSYSYLESYTAAALIYWLLSYIIEIIIDKIERYQIFKYGGKLV